MSTIGLAYKYWCGPKIPGLWKASREITKLPTESKNQVRLSTILPNGNPTADTIFDFSGMTASQIRGVARRMVRLEITDKEKLSKGEPFPNSSQYYHGSLVLAPFIATYAGTGALYYFVPEFREIVDQCKNWLDANPLTRLLSETSFSAMLTGTMPDLAAQIYSIKYENKKFSLPRLLSMTAWGAVSGLLFRGLVKCQHAAFGETLTLKNVLLRTATDQFIFAPFIFMPAFLSATNLINYFTAPVSEKSAGASKTKQKWYIGFRDLIPKAYALWKKSLGYGLGALAIVFSFPSSFRVFANTLVELPYLAVIAYFYVASRKKGS